MQQGHCFRSQGLNLCGSAAPTGAFAYESGSIEMLKELVRHQSGYTRARPAKKCARAKATRFGKNCLPSGRPG